MQESLAQGELAGDLYLGGTYGDPYLSGEVWPLWGSFRLWDALFSLDPGQSRLYFSPDRGILPRFALEARAEVRGYQVGLAVEGEFLRENGRVKVRLEPTFSSTPRFPRRRSTPSSPSVPRTRAAWERSSPRWPWGRRWRTWSWASWSGSSPGPWGWTGSR